MDKQTWESMPQQDREEWARFQAWQQHQWSASDSTQIPVQRSAATESASTVQSPKRRRRWPWAILIGVVAVAAGAGMALTTARSTGSVETDSATAASPSAVPTAEEAFVADVLDTPGLNSTMTDQAMVGIGRGACDVMAYQEYSREDLVAELGTSKLGPQVAAVMVDAAHRNLCPQYTFPSASSGQSGAPAPVATGPATSVSDGTYEVGADIEAGRYKTDGPIAGARACYQARLSDDSGDSSSIIANDITDGPSSVTIGAGEFVKFSGGCTWTMQGAS